MTVAYMIQARPKHRCGFEAKGIMQEQNDTLHNDANDQILPDYEIGKDTQKF